MTQHPFHACIEGRLHPTRALHMPCIMPCESSAVAYMPSAPERLQAVLCGNLPDRAINIANGGTHTCPQQACWTTVQGVFLLVAGGPGLGLWGADATSAMRPDAWTYLSIRGLGAPFTVILLVLQVLIALLSYHLHRASLLRCINHCLHQRKGEVLLDLLNACIVLYVPKVRPLQFPDPCPPAQSYSCGKCTVKDRTKSDLTKQDCQQEKKLGPIAEYLRDVQADRSQGRSSFFLVCRAVVTLFDECQGRRNMQFLLL